MELAAALASRVQTTNSVRLQVARTITSSIAGEEERSTSASQRRLSLIQKRSRISTGAVLKFTPTTIKVDSTAYSVHNKMDHTSAPAMPKADENLYQQLSRIQPLAVVADFGRGALVGSCGIWRFGWRLFAREPVRKSVEKFRNLLI